MQAGLVMVPAAPLPIINPNQPTSAHAQKAEEVAKTVYVGNLNPKVPFFKQFFLY